MKIKLIRKCKPWTYNTQENYNNRKQNKYLQLFHSIHYAINIVLNFWSFVLVGVG